mmetsp:Transcript_3741/g.7919  ORF Transcript_3741/g.7919 Transcript_3741/m.7919 type:complete len:395 (-) Transcript_3741:2032-3216(-)
MKIYIASSAMTAFAALSIANAHPFIRSLHRYGENGGTQRPRDLCYWSANNSQPLFDQIQIICDTSYDCTEVDAGSLDCNVWETKNEIFSFDEPLCKANMTAEEKESLREEMEDDREVMFDVLISMTEEERQAFHEENLAIDEVNAATVLGCGCCIGIKSIEGLVEGRQGAVAKALKLRPEGGRTDGNGAKGILFEGGRYDGDDEVQEFGHGHGRGRGPGMGGYPMGKSEDSVGQNDKGFRNGDGMHGGMFHDLIADECAAFNCTGVDETTANCTPGAPFEGGPHHTDGFPDFMDMTIDEMEMRHEDFLSCVCCMKNVTGKGFHGGHHGMGVGKNADDQQSNVEAGTTAFLSSSLVHTSEANSEVESIENSCTLTSASFGSLLVSAGTIFVASMI